MELVSSFDIGMGVGGKGEEGRGEKVTSERERILPRKNEFGRVVKDLEKVRFLGGWEARGSGRLDESDCSKWAYMGRGGREGGEEEEEVG